MTEFLNKYNLEERTSKFGENIIDFCRKIVQDVVTKPITSQLIRSATSIGANYMEANGASSKKDFRNKVYICKKESRETKYWLQMIAKADLETKERVAILWKEAHELTLIFSKILLTIEKKGNFKS